MVQRFSPIIIAGSGAIGAFVGGLLQSAGHEVIFLARSTRRDELGRHGLTLSDYQGLSLRLPPSSLLLAEQDEALPKAGLILLAVKSSATPAMAEAIKSLAPPQVPVVSLQNGVQNAPILRQLLPDRTIIPAMVPFNVVKGSEGHLHRGTSGAIVLGADIAGLAALLNSPALNVIESADIEAIQRGKLLMNLNNALNALSGLPLKTELSDRRWRKLLAIQIAEALRVYKAEGWTTAGLALPAPLLPWVLRLPDALFTRIAAAMLAIDPQARSSMWEDLQAHNTTEINEFQGLIITLARKHGLAAPVCERVVAAIHAVEAASRGTPGLSPDQI